MRWLILVLVASCAADPKPTSLEGSITCGSMMCGSGEICFSMDSGSQCDVNLDAGIGEYQQFGWRCGTLPDGCDVTQECFTDKFTIVSDDGRYVDQECI
jgi:hypothetical protein